MSYQWPSINSAALLAERLGRVTAFMDDRHLDHLVLSGFDSIRYATDYRTNLSYDSNYDWYTAIVDGDGQTTLITCDLGEDDLDPIPGAPTITRRVAGISWQSSWAHPRTYVRLLAAELRAAGAAQVGVEALPFGIMDELRRELPDVTFVAVGPELLRLRLNKTEGEVTLVAASAEAASIAMAAAMEGFQEGMTDYDVLALANDAAYRCDIEWLSHSVIVVESTPSKATWLAHGRRIWAGDTFFIDFGIYGQGGYAADFCRTHLGANAPDTVLAAHARLREALDAGAALAAPGVRCSAVTDAVNDELQGHGLPPTAYAMGHGIGLRMVEPPSIYRPDRMDEDLVLAEGMTICIEPSTSVTTKHGTVGMKEEEEYVVTATGVHQLTRAAVATGTG